MFEKMRGRLAPKVVMTIRFEGLTAAQVAAVHQAAENAKTDAHSKDGSNGEDQGGGRFVSVTKSEMKGEDGEYAILLTVTTVLGGLLHQPSANLDSKFVTVYPSRKGLDAVFDAAGILPAEDLIAEHKF